MLRDKHGWIRAKTAGNLSLGVSGNRFCDFLADPDSRSFRRFYTNMIRSRYLLSAAWRPAEHVLFLNLSCVCPEPVLVNRSFQNQKIWLKKRRFTHQGRCPHPGRAGCRRAFRVSCQCPGPRTPHRLCCGAASCEREERKRSSVSSLPYVCPEPVLVKLMIIFSSIKSGSKRERVPFSDLIFADSPFGSVELTQLRRRSPFLSRVTYGLRAEKSSLPGMCFSCEKRPF